MTACLAMGAGLRRGFKLFNRIPLLIQVSESTFLHDVDYGVEYIKNYYMVSFFALYLALINKCTGVINFNFNYSSVSVAITYKLYVLKFL